MDKITKRSSKSTSGARAGRPRSPAVDTAILEAALHLMAREGYARMSVDAVAAEAGVTKPTIYLRFPGGKAELATAALAYARERAAVEETGDTVADLAAHLKDFRTGVERPFGMSMIGTVLAEERHTPALVERFREHVVHPRRELLRAVLERARERGELAPDADVGTAVNMLVGAYYAQYLEGLAFRPDWAETVVGIVLDGLRSPKGRG